MHFYFTKYAITSMSSVFMQDRAGQKPEEEGRSFSPALHFLPLPTEDWETAGARVLPKWVAVDTAERVSGLRDRAARTPLNTAERIGSLRPRKGPRLLQYNMRTTNVTFESVQKPSAQSGLEVTRSGKQHVMR